MDYVGLQPSLNGVQVSWCGYSASLSSGTPQDGVWTITCTVPNTVNAGTYSVFPYAKDQLENWVNINGGPETPLRGTFTINGGLSDTTAPVIVSVSASPSTVSPGQTLTLSARVTDATGVDYVGLQPSLNGVQVSWCGYSASLSSGTPQDGVWTITCTVPNTVNAGTYSVFPHAKDQLENWVNINGGPETPLRGTFSVA